MALVSNRDELWEQLDTLGVPFQEQAGVLIERHESVELEGRAGRRALHLIESAAPYASGQMTPLGFAVSRATRLHQPVVCFETLVHRDDNPAENLRLVVAELRSKLGGDFWQADTQAAWFLYPAASVALSQLPITGLHNAGCLLRIMPAVPRTLDPSQIAALATYEPMWTQQFSRGAPVPEVLQETDAGFGFSGNDAMFVAISTDADVTVIDRGSAQSVGVGVTKIIDGKGGPGGGFSGAAFLGVSFDGLRLSLVQGADDHLDRLGAELASRLGVPLTVTTTQDF